MTVKCFVDSNVLVYARDLSERDKQQRASYWIEALAIAGAGRLSYQVLIEAYSALTRAGKTHMDLPDARIYISNFRHWHPLHVDLTVVGRAWQIQDRFGFSWWDCLIVAAAQISECAYLLTEDLQHGQDLEGVKVVDPFLVAPDALQRID
jgi:predicted nucleic acid-binding protein